MKKHLNVPHILGVAFICLGCYLFLASIYRTFAWEKTEGIVLELKQKEDENQWYPRVEFLTHKGERVEVDIGESLNRPPQVEGEPIPIIYPQDDYQEARINSFWWMWFFPLFMGGMGADSGDPE